MKSLLFLITSLFLSMNLLHADRIRTEIKEFTVGKKKQKVRIERIYRGKQLLVTSMIKNDKKTRIFEFTKDLSCAESDEDGDGFMESFIIYNDKTRRIEAFRRSKEGGIKVDPLLAENFKEGLEATDWLVSIIGTGRKDK